jgi:hypothetical protein
MELFRFACSAKKFEIPDATTDNHVARMKVDDASKKSAGGLSVDGFGKEIAVKGKERATQRRGPLEQLRVR